LFGRFIFQKEALMKSFGIGLLVFFLVAVSTANGAVTVVISGSGSSSVGSPASGQAFTLTASGTVLFKVYADSSTDIGRITLTGSGTVDLLIGSSGSFPLSQSTSFGSTLTRDWDGLALSSFSGSVRIAGKVGRDLTDSATATHIYRLQVDNDIQDVVTATGVDNSGDLSAAMPGPAHTAAAPAPPWCCR
jgi:hypothetical protein